MADYKLGSDDPKVRYDPGAGLWNSKNKTDIMKAFKLALRAAMPAARYVIGENARNHMRYYLRNEGRPYVIETVEKLVEDSGMGKTIYNDELRRAKRFVETLPVGTHRITSGRASKANNRRRGLGGSTGGSKNWFYAVGGYSAWGKGEATVTRAANGKRHYRLEFEYKFRDRYNWDKGKAVRIAGVRITDNFMGELHRQGLAKEFNMYGSWHHVVTWES